MEALRAARLDVVGDVVNVENFMWRRAGQFNRTCVNLRHRFAQPHGAGINLVLEEAGKREVTLHLRHVDGVRIREQNQAAAGEPFEKPVVQDWLGVERAIPNLREPRKCRFKPQRAPYVRVPLLGRQPTFLEFNHTRVGGDQVENVLPRQDRAATSVRSGGCQRRCSAVHMHAHDDLSDIKDQGLDRTPGGHYSRSGSGSGNGAGALFWLCRRAR